MKSVAAVIPAFNEEKTIETVVLNVKKYADPIVVDDASSDSTVILAGKSGAHIVRHTANQGYEQALESGFKFAMNMGFKYIITLDADGQHNPHLIAEFIKKLENGYDVIVGKRDKMQRIGEGLFALLGSRIWNISDPLCGMKAYRASDLEMLITGNQFDSVGTKYAIRAAKSGLKIGQINVKTNARIGRSRFGQGWKANKKILRAMTQNLFDLYPEK
jgi:glycosyltransferase involved in cell wall biosynthesis